MSTIKSYNVIVSRFEYSKNAQPLAIARCRERQCQAYIQNCEPGDGSVGLDDAESLPLKERAYELMRLEVDLPFEARPEDI